VFGAGKVKDLYKEADVDTVEQTNAELVDKLGKLPLMFQPGTVWEYGRSTDVLGRLVEVVSGMTLGEFFDKRIIKPLGMSDSAFWVPAEKLNRMAEPQAEPPENKKPVGIDITKPPKFEGGGQGLVATVSDYARFLQMLMNGGELDGVRILSRNTVEFMTASHLATVAQTEGPAYLPGPGFGFGLGFAVRTSEGVATTLGSRGEFTWGGYFGTNFWVDPKEKLFVVWMTQSPYWRTLYPPLLRNMVLQSIADNGNAE
jgi:CubicO group peptidase (beta-lactamase class C family)